MAAVPIKMGNFFKDDHFEHEGSYLQAQENNLGQNFLHRPQQETCRYLGLQLELQNRGFCCSHSFLTLTEQGAASEDSVASKKSF